MHPTGKRLEGRLGAEGAIARPDEVKKPWSRRVGSQVVATGTMLFDEGKANQDSAARRADLDRRIESWASQAREHYSTRIRVEPH